MTTISIRAGLLSAVAQWAAPPDATRPLLSSVVFRKNKMLATDGHRMVAVPMSIGGKQPSFGVSRADILAAVEAQRALSQQIQSMKSDVLKLTTVGDTDNPGHVEIRLHDGESHPCITVLARGIAKYPDIEGLVKSYKRQDHSPDGYLLNAEYLAAVREVVVQNRESSMAVRVVAWGSKNDMGERPALVLETEGGITFAIMPLRDM